MDGIYGRVITLILAGGKGERLYPLTKNRTKPSVPFGGVYKIIDFSLTNCLHSGCRRIFILVQYLSAPLIHHIWKTWDVFHSPNAGLLEVVPPQYKLADLWYRGTADAVFHNLNILQELRPDMVLILSGDHVYRMNYQSFLVQHVESGAEVSVAGIKMPLEDASRFGILNADSTGMITAFEEKPEKPVPMPGDPGCCLASMGIYIFNTELLVKTLAEDARDPGSTHDFGRDILPKLVKAGVPVTAYDFSSFEKKPYWQDIGTIDAYYNSSMDLLKDPPSFDLWSEEWPIRSEPFTLPPPLVASDTFCRKSILSPGVELRSCSVQGSILGPSVRVEPGAEVIDSVLLGNVKVGSNSRVRRSIVDAGVQIPDSVSIGHDREKDKRLFTISQSGLTLVPTGLPPEEGFHVKPGLL